jgi:hypothetical protein
MSAHWQFSGLGRFFGSDTTDMLLRNSSTGGFEVYDIANNNITGAAFLGTVGLNWQLAGFGRRLIRSPRKNCCTGRRAAIGVVDCTDGHPRHRGRLGRPRLRPK